jgi:bile acid-coenzyme A ligase
MVPAARLRKDMTSGSMTEPPMPDQAPEAAAGSPRGLGWLLSHQAARDPDRPAYTFDGRTWSRIELDRMANRMARALAGLGVGQDDLVAIVLPNGVDHHVYSFALWKLGATPMPLASKTPDHELAALLAISNPRLVIGVAAARALGFATLPADFAPDPSLSDAPLPEAISRRWKAIGSGGSTGRPKIIVDAKPATAIADQPAALMAMKVDDVLLQPAPIYHNSTFAQTNWGLVWGAHVIETPKFDAREWLRLVERYRVGWAYLVPTMMHRIWSLPEEERLAADLSSLRVVFHTAAPCPAWLKQAWIDWLGGERILEIYAGTEGVGRTVIWGDEFLTHPGSVGRAVGTEMKIFDEQGLECDADQVGEIHFRPPGGIDEAFHYLGGEARTRDGWITLGDLGRMDRDGYLYLADRRTDMIVSGGANIYPAEIEAALVAHPAIASSAVVGLPHPEFGRVPHALIELRAGADTPDAAELDAFLTERLARYKLPYTFEVSPAPLRDDAGKVRRNALRDDCETRLAAGAKFPALRHSKATA